MNSTADLSTRGRVSDFFNQHQISLFFILAFIITWSLLIPYIPFSIANPDIDPLSNDPVMALVGLSSLVATFGPAVSALIVSSISQGKVALRHKISRVFNWRINVKWYLVVFLLPLIYILLPNSLYVILSNGTLSNPILEPLVGYFGLYLVILLMGGGNEEIGWRGFALPRLQAEYKPIYASLILGILWGLWHLPLWFITWFSPFSQFGVDILGSIVAFSSFILISILGSFIIGWVYNNTNSIFLAMLAHSSTNFFSGLFRLAWVGDSAFIFDLVLLNVVAMLAVVIVLLVVTKGSLSYNREDLGKN